MKVSRSQCGSFQVRTAEAEADVTGAAFQLATAPRHSSQGPAAEE